MQYLYNDDPGNRIISGTSRDDLFDSGHPRPFSVEPEKRRTLSTVSKPSSGLGVEARNSDKSDSLSHRIDKLEKMISENRSRSNEKLEKVLNEVIADSDKISTREEIRKLRESIRPRLNPVRDRTSEITGHKVTANKHNASTSLGHVKQISSLKNNELGTSPKSSDSYVGLPSSRTYDGPQLKESTSQSFSTYRSTEPGLIIRNDFYGERVPGIFSAQPERPAHSSLPSFQLQHPGQSINYPQGNFQGLGQFGVLDRSHQLQMAPQYIQSSTGPHYEHFPHALYPQPVSTYPGTTPRQQFGVRGEQSWKEEDRESGYLFDVKRSRDSGVPKKLTRKFDSPNLSTESELSEGLELSVDENGILWDEDQADTGVSEDLDSFRLSPSGSETAGDFDSSLLLSGSGSQPLPGKTDGHRQKLDEIAETDEESSYCGLPVVNRRSQDQIGDRQLGRDLTDSAGNGVLRTNKGGMVSDIVSVRDKMMKYLDEGDLKERKPNLRNEEDSVHLRGTANLASSRLSHGVDNECLNNSHALQQASKPSSYNSSNVGKDRQITKQAYQMESSDDNTSSSYAPLKLSASKSRFKKSESFDLDAGHSDTKNTPSKYTTVGNNASAHGDKQEVVEESIQPQTKTSVRLPLDISRKLNLLSSSSESFEQLPRRRPVVKKRTVKNIKTKEDTESHTESLDAKDKDQDNKQPITNNSQPKDALTTDRSPIMLSEKNTKEERIPDLPQAVNPKALESFENRDSVLGTSIGSDQVDDAQLQETEPSKESSKDMLAQREESGLTSSLDSLDDLDKYEGVPLKKAEPLRLTFADEETSDDEEQSKGSPVTVPVASPPACREESTDFDFESDLERLSTPMQIKPGLKGRSKKNKVLTHKKTRGSSSRKLSIPKVNADVMPTESSDAASDVSKVTRQKHDAARRRRVALFCVFRYLDTRTLSQMALVSREWRHVSRHPELWKKVELKNERVSSSFLVTISQWCSRLRQITLEGLQCRQRRSDETLEQYQQNMRGCLETGLEELFKSCQNSLVSLQIIACGNHLTNKCLWLVSCYCRLLEELHYISSTDPVTAEVLWAIGGGCPGVTTLIVPPLYPCLKPKTFNNKCLVLIAKFYPDLLKLGIGGQEIGIGGLLPLVQGCQRLQYLELDHISELTSDDATALCRAGLRQLSVLEINATPISPDAVKQIYKSCRHLKRLRILLDFQDYFENATKKNKQEYKKKIQKLQDLLKQPGLGNVLKIQAAPVD